jgi:predicted RND superfamily exporter protein
VREAEQYVGEHPEAPFSFVGGFGALFSEIELTVVHGQVTSLIVSLLLVALLVALLFRSLTAALLGSLPLGLALLLLFGIMGHAGIELNIVTAMLSAIMIGVGIDYTIHFLWRYKDERQLGLEPVEAVRLSLVTSGRGIVYNALSVVVGFAVLMLSAFMPVKYFGALVVLSILTCLVGALVLLPAVVVLWRPRFLEPRAPSPEQ